MDPRLDQPEIRVDPADALGARGREITPSELSVAAVRREG